MSLNLDTQTLGSPELTAHTEQTWTMRVLDSALHVPYADPQGSNANPENGQLAASAGSGSWDVVTSCAGVTHAFDVAKTSYGLFLFGSDETGDQGVIWQSTDDGATWTVALAVDAPGGAIPGWARFYACAQFGDTLLAYFTDQGASPEVTRAFICTAGPWSEITDHGRVADTLCPFTLDGTPFWLGRADGRNAGPVGAVALRVLVQPSDAAGRAAIEASLPNTQIFDAATDDTSLYMLADGQHVWRGDTSGTWTDLFTLTDATCRSIAVDAEGGFLYFGTTDSRILRTPIPA